MMTSFSQRDPRWVGGKLGGSGLTIGRYGCTVTDIADLSTYFGDNLTPDQVAAKISFNGNGEVLWNSCQFKHFKFSHREYGRNDAGIIAALKDPNKAVILQVSNGSHWVVATGRNFLGGQYNIADPWFGDRATLRRYGLNITGAAYFERV